MQNSELGINMKNEINQIKEALTNTISNFINSSANSLPKDIYDFKNICIIACGTSYHSGLIGKKILEKNLNIPCEVILANEFELSSNVHNKNTLFIFISQSGKTTDVLNVLNLIQPFNPATLAITNSPGSTLQSLCNYSIILCAGEEKAIASTKAFNCQILAFLMLAYTYIFSTNALFKKLDKLIAKINKIDFEKFNSDKIKKLSEHLKDQHVVYFIGKGYDHTFAKESALKLKETCYIHTISLPTLEMLHGTMAVFNENDFVVAIVTQPTEIEQTNQVLKAIKESGAKVAIISTYSKKLFKSHFDLFIPIPKVADELSLVLNIIPSQWLAYHTSISLGNNPDSPRRLVKAVIWLKQGKAPTLYNTITL